jgi:hypothetical protein
MAYNGSGAYALPAGNPVVSGTTISSTWANTTLADIAAALSLVLVRDGQAAMTGALNMGTQNITNVGSITAGSIVLTAATIPANGWYLSAANTIAAATAGVLRLNINGTGNATLAAPSSGAGLTFLGNESIRLQNNSGFLSAFNTAGTVRSGYLQWNTVGNTTLSTEINQGFDLLTNNIARVNVAATGGVTINTPASGVGLIVGGSDTIPHLRWGNGTTSAELQTATTTSYIGTTTATAFAIFTSNVVRLFVSSSGQTTIYEPLNAINALKNAATYETGSFTGTLTGCQTSPTATFNWSRSGNIVTIICAAGLTAISNASTCTITGVPAALNQINGAYAMCGVIDNGLDKFAAATINGATISLFSNVPANVGNTFTSSGTKGIRAGFLVVYQLT